MIELTGNLWNYHVGGIPICITINGAVRKDGACVMGRGIAAQAAQKFPMLPYTIGKRLRAFPMEVEWIEQYGLFTFPVKFLWHQPADLGLIETSAVQLRNLVNDLGFKTVGLPRPGCGNGGLEWEVVKPHLHVLDDRFEVVEWKP